MNQEWEYVLRYWRSCGRTSKVRDLSCLPSGGWVDPDIGLGQYDILDDLTEWSNLKRYELVAKAKDLGVEFEG